MKELSTLVVLDGLDKINGCSMRILDEAKNGCHLLLATSKLYGVGHEFSIMDTQVAALEVLHKGVGKDQVKEYVKI